MNGDAGKFHITACTLVYPYLDKGVGRFIDWYKTDEKGEFNGLNSFIKAKLSENDAKRLGFASILDSARTEVDLVGYSEKLLQVNQDFVRFGIKEDNPHSIWEFSVTPQKQEEIWTNSQAGAYIQLFDLTFYQDIQQDPFISILRSYGLKSGLLFQSENHNALGVGFIDRHRSMILAEYEAITGSDPITLQAHQHYYDPIAYNYFKSEEISFDQYLRRIKSRFAQA